MSSMNDETPPAAFSEFKLEGERFDGGRLPIEALAELERYRSLLLAAAENAWQLEHPGAEIPDDFSREFDLAITDVRDGSAISILERPESQYDQYFDRGRDEVDALFRGVIENLTDAVLDESQQEAGDASGNGAAASESASAQSASPEDVSSQIIDSDAETTSTPAPRTLRGSDYVRYAQLPAFRDFGSSLQPGEAAEIATPNRPPVIVTMATRTEKIRPLLERVDELLQPPKIQRTHDENSVAGRLVALNAERRNYTLQTLLYGEINGRYKSNEMTADLKAVLDSSAHAPVVRVVGRMSWKAGRLEKILEAQEVELLEVADEPWSRRVVELASLPQGWDEETGGGTPIAFVAIELARELLRAVNDAPFETPRAGMFPMLDGGVLVEWTASQRVVSAEISADGEIYVHSFVLSPRASREFETTDVEAAKEAVVEELA